MLRAYANKVELTDDAETKMIEDEWALVVKSTPGLNRTVAQPAAYKSLLAQKTAGWVIFELDQQAAHARKVSHGCGRFASFGGRRHLRVDH